MSNLNVEPLQEGLLSVFEYLGYYPGEDLMKSLKLIASKLEEPWTEVHPKKVLFRREFLEEFFESKKLKFKYE